MQSKSIFQSTTFWVAMAQAVAGALVIFQTTYPQLGWLALAKSFVDIALRFKTVQPVTLSTNA